MSQPTASNSAVALAALLEDISSPDPAIRDGESLGTLCDIVDSGMLSQEMLSWLGSQLTDRLSQPQVEARSFAALVLGILVINGALDPEWFQKFAHWCALGEEATGYDDRGIFLMHLPRKC